MSEGERFRAHPAFGYRPLPPGEPISALTESQLPDAWNSQDEDERDEWEEEFYRSLINAVVRGAGDATLTIDIADPAEGKVLRAAGFSEVSPMKFSAGCDEVAVGAVLRCNPTWLSVETQGHPVMFVADTWDGVVLLTQPPQGAPMPHRL